MNSIKMRKLRADIRDKTIELILYQLKFKKKNNKDDYINMNTYLIDNVVTDIINENYIEDLKNNIDDSLIFDYLYRYLPELSD